MVSHCGVHSFLFLGKMHNARILFTLSLRRQNINVTYMLGMHLVLLLNSHQS